MGEGALDFGIGFVKPFEDGFDALGEQVAADFAGCLARRHGVTSSFTDSRRKIEAVLLPLPTGVRDPGSAALPCVWGGFPRGNAGPHLDLPTPHSPPPLFWKFMGLKGMRVEIFPK